MIVTRTPLRVPLGGGGTDLPSYYSRNGGYIVSAAINKYTYITVNRRFEDSIRVSYSQTEIVDSVEDIQHRYVREALKYTGIEKGIRFAESNSELEENIKVQNFWRYYDARQHKRKRIYQKSFDL